MNEHSAYSAWSSSTITMLSLCAVIVIVISLVSPSIKPDFGYTSSMVLWIFTRIQALFKWGHRSWKSWVNSDVFGSLEKNCVQVSSCLRATLIMFVF